MKRWNKENGFVVWVPDLKAALSPAPEKLVFPPLLSQIHSALLFCGSVLAVIYQLLPPVSVIKGVHKQLIFMYF